MGRTRRPCTSFIDAARTPARIGGVLVDPARGIYRAFEKHVPWRTRHWFRSRKQPIMQYEMLGVHVALSSWREWLAGRRVIFWVDNRAAERIFVRGSARAPDANLLASWFWQRCAIDRVRPEIFRVASSSNCADGPSRGDWSLLGPGFERDRVMMPPELDPVVPRSEVEALIWGAA